MAIRVIANPTWLPAGGDDGPGQVRVLVSATERRLDGDLDPLDDYPDQTEGGLVNITSSVGLSTSDTELLIEHLTAYAHYTRKLETQITNPGDTTGNGRKK